jgi:hypothetical protein
MDKYVGGVKTGERDVGNARMFVVTAPTVEKKEKLSYRVDDYGQVLESKIMKNVRKVKINLDDIAGDYKENLDMATFGVRTVVTGAGGSVTAESVTAYLGKGSKLANKNVTANTIVVKAATPTEWAAGHAYSLGDFMEPTTPNTYRYECTTAGTSAAVTEPTWGTTVGGTTSDGAGALVWTCRKMTYTLTTDYTVSTTAGITHIIPVSGAGITASQTLKVDYDYTAYSGYKISADDATETDVFMRLVGKNVENGDYVEVVVHKARFTPTSDLPWIGLEYVSVELEGDMLVTTDGTWYVEVIEN